MRTRPTRCFGSATSDMSGLTATTGAAGAAGGGGGGGGGAPPHARPHELTANQNARCADLIFPPNPFRIVRPVYTASRTACHAADHAECASLARESRRPAKCCTPRATKSGVRKRKRSILPRFLPKK